MVALVIITTVLLVLAATTYTAFGSIGFSRQRDTATGLANQAMEQIKALSFNNLVMSQTDVSSDSLVTCSGSPTVCKFNGRTIPTVSSGTLLTASNPLYPHVVTSTPQLNSTTAGQSAYTVSSYVTFDPSGNTQARLATVRVTWSRPDGGATALVQIESTIFATGTVTQGTGHVWSAQAVDSPGTISIGLTTGGILANILGGANVASLSFGPGSANATIASNGTASATSSVAASSLQLLNGSPILSTGATSSSASKARGSSGVSAQTSSVADTGPLAPIAGLIGLDTATLGITATAGITNNTGAEAASSSQANMATLATTPVQTMPNSLLPFAQAGVAQTGPIQLGLNLSVLSLFGINVFTANIPILSITPLGNGQPDLTTVCQQSSSGAGCANAIPAISGVSQPSYPGAAIYAQAQKSFTSIEILPNSANPHNSLLDIEGFTSAASAAAGVNGSGTIANSGLSSESAVNIYSLGSGPLSLTSLINGTLPLAQNLLEGLLGTLGVTVQLSGGTATNSGNSALVTSPLSITIGLSLAGLLNLSLVVNLGQVSASASYS